MWRMLSGLSLRVKITGGFVLVVVLATLVSTIIGSRIVTTAMLDEALKRSATGLRAGRAVYDFELDRVRRSVVLAATSYRIGTALQDGASQRMPQLLSGLRSAHELDFLTYVDHHGARIRAGGSSVGPGAGDDAAPPPEATRAAWDGTVVASTEVLDAGALRAEEPSLVQRARIRITAVPRTRPGRKADTDAGLVLLSASPVRIRNAVVGVVYGGRLLNRSTELVDRVRDTVFGGETYEGQQVGTVSVFLDDVRVSTNVMRRGRVRAIGTRASAEVAETVLARGEPWKARAFVVDGYRLAAYEPIRDHGRRVIGMLYVGVLEKPFLAVRTQMMMTFLAVVIAGVLIVLGLAYATTRGIIHPLEEMVAASKRIAAGDLDQRVRVPSRDEVGLLASSFNKMVESLEATRAELEDSKHNLEERVRQRTEQLMAIQGQMAHSEKLASLGRMASGVAHEINNPLGGILTFAMLAQEDTAPDHPLRKNLDVIVKQTLRCREIVKGLLDFSRHSDAVATLTDVHTVIDSTLALLDRQALFHDIVTERRLTASAPLVRIDPSRLQQVIINLVVNAVDAMDGRGTLTVATDLDAVKGELALEVSDTGKGIPPEIRPMIFEPFFTTKEVGKGTGLGLSIVHGIVTQAEGSVAVRSAEEGTTFTVRFPAAKSPGASDG